MEKLLLQLKARTEITNILLKYLLCKWKHNLIFMISTIMVLALQLMIPILLNRYYNGRGFTLMDNETLVTVEITYALFIGAVCLYLFFYKNSNAVSILSREIKYLISIMKFLELAKANVDACINNKTDMLCDSEKNTIYYNGRVYSKDHFIRIIIYVINTKLLLMYLANKQNQLHDDNSKIFDREIIVNLIHSNRLNLLNGSMLFQNGNTIIPYNELLNKIYNSTINTLNKKKWFKDNFNKNEVYDLIEMVLSFWYDNFPKITTSK